MMDEPTVDFVNDNQQIGYYMGLLLVYSLSISLVISVTLILLTDGDGVLSIPICLLIKYIGQKKESLFDNFFLMMYSPITEDRLWKRKR